MGNIVLITGGSSGIGRCIAEVYAREGKDLLLVAKSYEKLSLAKKTIEDKYPVKVDLLSLDLSQYSSVKKITEYTKEKGYTVETLVNCAGFGDFGKFFERDIGKQLEMIDVNIRALTELTYYYLKEMEMRNTGDIINVASMAGFMPGPLFSVYYASKAYVKSFTEAVAREMRGTGVKVMALCPGPTLTGFEERAEAQSSGLFKKIKNALPEEVAEYALKSLRNGKTVALPGIINKLLVMGTRFLPDSIIRDMVYSFNSSTRRSSEKPDEYRILTEDH